MTKTTFTALALGTLVTLTAGAAFAGTITVNNQSKTSVLVKVVADGNVASTKEITVPESASNYEFNVDRTDIEGKTIFTLNGKTGVFTGDKCKNLSVDSDYLVTFTNDTVGTTCIAVPVAAAVK